MSSKTKSRILAIALTVVMLVCAIPTIVFASVADWFEKNEVYNGTTFGTNGYYNVISEKDLLSRSRGGFCPADLMI